MRAVACNVSPLSRSLIPLTADVAGQLNAVKMWYHSNWRAGESRSQPPEQFVEVRDLGGRSVLHIATGMPSRIYLHMREESQPSVPLEVRHAERPDKFGICWQRLSARQGLPCCFPWGLHLLPVGEEERVGSALKNQETDVDGSD